jgi:hypothetical protein
MLIRSLLKAIYKNIRRICMKRIGQIKYELSEQEYKEIKNLVRDIADYFDHKNSYRDAKFSIQRLSKIINACEEEE